MPRLGRPSWKSAATAACLACVMTFANLASGADRIDNRHPSGRIRVGGLLAPARGLAAGDRVQRLLELASGGRSRAKLVVKATSSALVAPRGGLRLRIDRCSKTWGRRGSAYSCAGTTSVVLADGTATGSHTLRKLARHGKNHLRLTLTVPQSAANALQARSARLTYRFG